MTESESARPREIESAKIYMDDGIIMVEVKDDAVIDLQEAMRHSEIFEELLAGRVAPLLIVFGKKMKQSKEARDFFSRNPTHVSKYSAVALLVMNPLDKVFANFYLGINRPTKPTRMFTSKERAMEWLAQYR